VQQRSRLTPITLTDEEREQLADWARGRRRACAIAKRARIVLACDGGRTNREVARRLRVTTQTVGKWRARFVARRLEGRAVARRARSAMLWSRRYLPRRYTSSRRTPRAGAAASWRALWASRSARCCVSGTPLICERDFAGRAQSASPLRRASESPGCSRHYSCPGSYSPRRLTVAVPTIRPSADSALQA
jgi:Homeodomain-like domain